VNLPRPDAARALRILPLVLLWAACGFGFLGCQKTPPPSPPRECVVDKFEVYSASMGKGIEVAVLLPPEYAGGSGKYPVLYALHGKDAPYLTYMSMPPLKRFLVDHPMLVVTFSADKDSCYIDARGGRPNSFFTTFFFKELMPEIARRYRTDSRTAVTGFSMGGYGAMHYMLEQPGLFTSVSAQSGAFALFEPKAEKDDSKDGFKKGERRAWLESLLGPRSANRAAYDAALLAPRITQTVAAGTKLPPLLMICGTGDRLLGSNRNFVDLLQTVNAKELAKHEAELKAIADPKERRARLEAIQKSSLVDFEYRESPGGHDWPYWVGSITTIAEFHWKNFGPPKQ